MDYLHNYGGRRHGQITRALADLDAELMTTGADEETCAAVKAEYCMAQNLVADTIQAMFMVENPSSTLLKNREELIQEICS